MVRDESLSPTEDAYRLSDPERVIAIACEDCGEAEE